MFQKVDKDAGVFVDVKNLEFELILSIL